MTEKFKVGDKIRRKLSCHVYAGKEGVIKRIEPMEGLPVILYVHCSDGSEPIWSPDRCVLVKGLEKLCKCKLDILMSVGCQCKGN